MNRWYFWVLAPVMLVTGLGLPLIVDPPTVTGEVVLYVFSATLVFATIGLAAPGRFWWALRLVAAAILVAYLAYATHEIIRWWNGKPFGLQSAQSDSNLRNALLGLFIFGLPAMYFLLTGRTGTDVDTLVAGDTEFDDGREDDEPRET
jgi:hypothetical protein